MLSNLSSLFALPKASQTPTGVAATPKITFGNTSLQERTDRFTRQEQPKAGKSEPIQDQLDIQSNRLEKTPDENSPKVETASLTDDFEDDDDDENYAEHMLKTAKPFEVTESAVPTIQNLRMQTAKQLGQILSRPHLNSAELVYDEPKLKEAVLAQLQADLGNAPMLNLDCAGIEPKKNGGFFSDDKKEYHLVSTLEEVIPQLEAKFDTGNASPLVLLLKNVEDDELENLQDSKTYRAFQEKFPNVRLIVPYSSEEASNSNSSWKKDDDEATEWRSGQFQVLSIPSLKPVEWATVIKKDAFSQQLLSFWSLDASEDILREFFEVLKKESKDAPLTYDTLLAELDALGSFVKPEVNGDEYPLSKRHIKSYSQQVLKQRRKHAPTAGGPANMGPPPYDIINSGDINVKMDDVVGHDEVKKVLLQALKEAKYPETFSRLNENDPDSKQNTILLMGEPGTGKTMLAKALAAEGGATLISTSGSRFVNGLVGGGANAIRRLWDAIGSAEDDLVIAIVDEIDALSSRDSGPGGASNDENNKTNNELLVKLDGLNDNNGKTVVFIGATNRPEALDPALLSRFTNKIEIQKLDRKQRLALLEKKMEQKHLVTDDSVNLKAIARRTSDFSGRDLKNMMKLVKDKQISNLSTEELEKLEHDKEARESFKLVVSQRDLIEGIREVRKGWQKIEDNSDTGAYGGGKNGKKPPVAITL